ncbi:MAG TPA: SMI1/KNR4 family protein [Gemmatimonadaceae bacterium]|jgi:hypothetical protein|nr:SMI1/KNR4 family protein [Gemmatimonadaceae bacterium]
MFDGITYVGPPVDDQALLDELPRQLADILRQTNGLVACGGAFHIRGVCTDPAWHSLRAAWRGPRAFVTAYRSAQPTDIPFAQDALGDQYLLREGGVWRLSTESDEVEICAESLTEFLEEVSADPIRYLMLGHLVAFWNDGGALAPGQLLSVYPPLVTEHNGGYSYRAISAADRLGALVRFASQVRDLPDGTTVSITTTTD